MPLCHRWLPILVALVAAAPLLPAAVTADQAWHPVGTGGGISSGTSIWSVLNTSAGTYVSGSFSAVDGVTARGIALWNGSAWSAPGGGLDGEGDDLVSDGSHVYVIGKFAHAGVTAAANVAAWNGSAWAALAAGVPNYPYAATMHNGSLYAAGGSPPWVQKWNGTSWDPVVSGVGGWIYKLASCNGKLIIGGDFTGLGSGTTYDYLASWDGTSLSGLGTGVNFVVGAMSVDPTNQDLYVSGSFTNRPGCIARWNGSAWSALGNGLDRGCGEMVHNQGILYAIGGFSTAGGSPAANVATWNGTTWSALGSGVDDEAYAGCLTAQGLLVGGRFRTAGGQTAGGIALHSTIHVADAQTFTVETGVAHAGTLVAHREDATALTVAVGAGPSHGTLVIDNAATGAFTYTSDAAFTGADQFIFSGSDGAGTSNSALVDITVVAPASPPPATSAVGHGGCAVGAGVSSLLLLVMIGVMGWMRRIG